MNLAKITAVALSLLLVGAGAAAAMPGQADSHANDNATDADTPDDVGGPDVADNATDEADNATDENESADARDTDRGPPTDMPSQVPDHVVEIHQTINDWLDGDQNASLGDLVSDIVGGDDESSEDDSDSDEDAEEDTEIAEETSTETPTDDG